MGKKFAFACAAALVPLGAPPAMAAMLENESSEASSGAAAGRSSATGVAGTSQETIASGTEDGWQFAVTPYLWVAGVSGDVQLADGESVDIDTDFTDILSDLKFAGMLALEARNRRFVLLGDVIYLSLGTKSEGPLGFVEAEVDPAIFVGTLAAGYRVVDRGPLFLDIFAGGRLTALDVDVELSGPLQTIERSRSKSSIAPVAGARFRAPLGDRWGIAVYGDVGGFGATADMTWQLMGTVQYDLGDHWRIAAGYRHVSISHDKDNFDVDLALSGPIVGFSYRF